MRLFSVLLYTCNTRRVAKLPINVGFAGLGSGGGGGDFVYLIRHIGRFWLGLALAHHRVKRTSTPIHAVASSVIFDQIIY